MSDKIYVGTEYDSFRSNGELAPISKVCLIYDDDRAFEAGDDTGRTLEVEVPWATQAMADAILAQLRGYVYRPYEATGASVPPEAELGDTVTVGTTFSEIAAIKTELDPLSTADIGAPIDEEVEQEYQYVPKAARELKRRVALGKAYYGTRITRNKGLEIVKTLADGTEKSRVKLNSDVLEFLTDVGERALYFDSATGEYVFRGYIRVQDGHLIFEGSSKMIQERYSTNKTAAVPSGWSTEWSSDWDNTDTEVWAIYSYDAGTTWTDPRLIQGRSGEDGEDGAQGPQGPQGPRGYPGSDANVPDWVTAYTDSAEYNTLVTNEWVIAMNLYGSKIFAGDSSRQYALMTPDGLQIFDASGNLKINLALTAGSSYDTPYIKLGVGSSQIPAGLIEKFGRGLWIGTADVLASAAQPTGGTGVWIDFVSEKVYKVVNGTMTEIGSGGDSATVTAVWG